MKNYYIQADILEYMPRYDFVVQAETMEEARAKAWEIVERDYDIIDMKYANIDAREVTPEKLLELMTIDW